MKKIISILLVAMLLVSLFPATPLTANAADTTIEFALGANGTAAHKDGSSAKTTYSETNGSYTLSLTGGTKMYPSSYDAKGNSCIKLGTGSATGGFNFTVPSDVTGVVIAIAKYKTNTSKVTINGTTHTLTKSSNNGEYDEITVDTTSNKTVTLTTASGGVRAMVNTITYVIPAAEGACEHPEEKLTLKTAQQDATCTAVGYEAIYTCECGEVVGGAEIPAINHKNKTLYSEAVAGDCKTEGTDVVYFCPDCEEYLGGESTGLGDHNYVNDTCTICGEAKPTGGTATISFADTNDRVSYSTSSQVWQDDDNIITFTNNKASSTSNVADYSDPCRLYKSSEIIVSCESGYVITSITFVAGGSSTYKTPWEATLTAAGVTPDVDGDNYTVNFASGVESFTCTASAQIRIASLSATYVKAGGTEPDEPACQHPNTTEQNDGYAAQCGVPGMTNSVVCDDCGETVTEQTEIPALTHNFANGSCTNCGTPDPFTTLAGRYYIATKRSSGSYWYMTSDLGTATTKRYQAVNSGLTELPAEIAEPEDGFVFIFTRNADGTFSIQAEGVEGNNYLSWTSGNSGTFAAAGAANTKFTAELNDDGTYSFCFTADSETRYLSLNEQDGSDYFAWYKGTQKQNLTLIPVAAAPIAEVNGNQYSSMDEALEEIAANGGTLKLLAEAGDINVEGNLKVDLNGYNAGYVSVSGELEVIDSKATVTTASGAKLAGYSCSVICKESFDANYVRYILLEESDGSASAHVLQLNVSHVTLRTTTDPKNTEASVDPGLYFKTTINCDPQLAAAVSAYGTVLSAGETTAQTTIETNGMDKNVFTSGSVFGIFKSSRSLEENVAYGQADIFARGYIRLNEENSNFELMTENNYNTSMKSLLSQITDDFYAGLTEPQQAAYDLFTSTWADVIAAL